MSFSPHTSVPSRTQRRLKYQRDLEAPAVVAIAATLPKFPAEALERELCGRRARPIISSRTHTIQTTVDVDKVDWWNLNEGPLLTFPTLSEGFFSGKKRKRKKREAPKFSYIHPAPVSKKFRAMVWQFFPALDKDSAYWRFFSYLIVGDFFDRDSGQLILSREVVAEAMGKAGDKNVKAKEFIERFKRDVMGDRFDYQKTCVAKMQARYLKKLDLPEELGVAMEAEDFIGQAGKVNLSDGRAYDGKKAAAYRKRLKNAAMQASESARNPEAREMLIYLNNLPHNLFTKIWKHSKEVKAMLAAMPEGRSKQQIKAYMRGIMREPQPFYAPSKGLGDRIFGIGGNMTMVGEEIRQRLAPEWYEADLKNSQLAILARIAEIKEVESFLRHGGDVWSEFCHHMGVPSEKWREGKRALKGCLYPATYCMGIDKLKKTVIETFNEQGLVGDPKRFLSHWIIKELLKARTRLGKTIQKHGGMETCYGRFIERKEIDACDFEGAETQTHQIMALVAQALEMHIIYPAFELAKNKREEFTITLAQHDGFSVKFHRRADHWRREIKKKVQERINGWEIRTVLEWKDPKGLSIA
jgi:hypothetical protein